MKVCVDIVELELWLFWSIRHPLWQGMFSYRVELFSRKWVLFVILQLILRLQKRHLWVWKAGEGDVVGDGEMRSVEFVIVDTRFFCFLFDVVTMLKSS